MTPQGLRTSLVKEVHHHDILQEVLLYMTQYPEQYTVSTDNQFIKLVESHFYRRLWTLNLNIRKGFGVGDLIGHRLIKCGVSLLTHNALPLRDVFGIENTNFHVHREETHYAVNPWATQTINVLEYLELIPQGQLRQMMQWYYIEGYTLQEIAHGVKTTPIAVLNRLRTGVKVIKKAISKIEQR